MVHLQEGKRERRYATQSPSRTEAFVCAPSSSTIEHAEGASNLSARDRSNCNGSADEGLRGCVLFRDGLKDLPAQLKGRLARPHDDLVAVPLSRRIAIAANLGTAQRRLGRACDLTNGPFAPRQTGRERGYQCPSRPQRRLPNSPSETSAHQRGDPQWR